MLHRLKERWQVSWPRFVLIFITFALGGSACARAGSWLLSLVFSEKTLAYWLLYIPIISILWPLSVLVISIPLGQFRFFRNYLRKMGARVSGRRMKRGRINPQPHQLAIFASGTGTNAANIIEYFRNSPQVRVALIVCNNPKAGVLQIAADNNIPVLMVNKQGFYETRLSLEELQLHNITLLVLAGFLWKIPGYLIEAFPGRIINIHPALLPSYGGKGMYGSRVHAAVIAAGDKETGITIHYVDEHYDNGDVIFQARCPVMADDTPDSVATRVHQLEHQHYPEVIERLLKSQ